MRFNSKLLSAIRLNTPNVANAMLCCNAYFFFPDAHQTVAGAHMKGVLHMLAAVEAITETR